MRTCLYCGKELVQRPDERNASFAKRDTCNKSCAGLRTAERKRPTNKKLKADLQFFLHK